MQITGTVVADGGGPLEGVCVRIYPYDAPWIPYDASAACTDANGEFASIGFAPGRYAFFVRAVNLPYFSESYDNGEVMTLAAPGIRSRDDRSGSAYGQHRDRHGRVRGDG